MPECVEVVITGPTPEWAEDLAQLLVEERLAACVHIVPEMRSVYRWEEEINDDPETRLNVHTRAELVPALTDRVCALHSYDVPCVMALPIVGGLPSYLQWVIDNTRDA
ncbi:divalent-cation tolerance protein CutA [Gephyromycinifex aptenodytis]|uniref:divalent-cation tolerance protein CutA n=1 Tax=Gephyromycinifex aptenodytis TaxID=2716227 RepID=UPI0014455240|nr:divalent-cation tolerance protein CutA [Gephyromycinifex aptenodytis]